MRRRWQHASANSGLNSRDHAGDGAGAGGEYPHLRKKSATRVLVVDDEPLVRWSIAETLRDRGYDIVEASDARGALAAIQAIRPPNRTPCCSICSCRTATI